MRRGGLDLTDAMTILTTLFLDGTPLPCQDAADVDDNGDLNMGDAIFLLQFLFVGGVEVSAPYPSCGVDPTADALDCTSFPECP
jgi:hypothetical protein